MKTSGLRAVEIRPLVREDVPKIPDFFEGLSENSRYFYHPYKFNGDAVSRIEGELDRENCAHLGAFRRSDGWDRMVGHVWYIPVGQTDYPVLGIAVVDSLQNAGIGQQLMQRIQDEARERGVPGIQLTCLLENHRGLRVYSKYGYRLVGKNGRGDQFRMLRSFADDESPFVTRGVYASTIPWNIAPLTTDNWTFKDWKWYLELLNAAGCNLLKIYIWSSHYFHPDEPALAGNAWRYDVWHSALEYAHTLGMETLVGFSSATVPPSTWLRFPELRAEEIWYTGTTLCWRRGRDRILPFQEYLIERFTDVADGFALWFADPGACICSQCRDYFAVMMDSLEVLKGKTRNGAELIPCPWCVEAMEAGRLGFAPHPRLRRRIMKELPRNCRVIVNSSEEETLDIVQEEGGRPLPLAFFLDPEGGFESKNVLPEPKFEKIDSWIESSRERKRNASLAYRLTPYTQFPGDFYFLRRQLQPEESRESVLLRLGELTCNERREEEYTAQPARFASAIELLDQWWRDRKEKDLGSACEVLSKLARDHSLIRHLADSAAILKRIQKGPGAASLEEFTEELRLEMSDMPIFQGLTLDFLWSSRARVFLQFRISEWLQRLQE